MVGDRRIAIIDLDSVLFSAAWGNKIPDPDNEGEFLRDEKGRLIYQDKTDDEIATSLDLILNTILEETEATHYVFFVKGSKTGSHRYKAKSDYKSNRPKESPKWWDFTKNYALESWKAIEVNEIEVDDAVNIARLNIHNSFIVAIDKDLLNLEGTHYNWRTKEWITTSRDQEEICLWRDMISGQKGDGIQGLAGKGDKHFEKISSHLFKMDSNYDIYLELPKIVLSEYIRCLGQQTGIQEFYKNYTCLKILEEHEGFEIPEPIEYEKVIKERDIEGEIDDLWLWQTD